MKIKWLIIICKSMFFGLIVSVTWCLFDNLFTFFPKTGDHPYFNVLMAVSIGYVFAWLEMEGE